MSLAKPSSSFSEAPITLSQICVRLECGDSLEIGNLSLHASCSRNEGDFRLYFRINGHEVRTAWS